MFTEEISVFVRHGGVYTANANYQHRAWSRFSWVLGLNTKKQLVSVIQIPTVGVTFKNIGAVLAISIAKGVKVKVGKTEQHFRYGACTVGICETTGMVGRKLQRVLNKPTSVAVTFYTNQGKE